MTVLNDEVIRALNERDWPDYVVERLGARVGDAVAPTLRPAVGRKRIDKVTVGCSKFGGLPDVDSTFRWPTEDDTDEPLALVCQLRLAEAGPASGGVLPSTGMLYLFCIYDGDRAYGYEIDNGTAKVVHVPDPGPLARAPRPDGLGDEGVFREQPFVLLPSVVTEELDEDDGQPAHARFDASVEDAIDEVLGATGNGYTGSLRMLGNAHLWREETQDSFDMGTQTLLLYVSGWDVDQAAFGEGDFNLIIDNADLAAGRLGSVDIVYSPGT
jgi:hypothetical protein